MSILGCSYEMQGKIYGLTSMTSNLGVYIYLLMAFVTVYSRFFFMGGNFREKLEEASRIKFRGFKFCGVIGSQMT